MQIYQEIKTNEGTLRGYLHQPEFAQKVPLVIMYHGFTGYKGENKFLFVQFSRYLCERNIASLRFDFLGSGESDNDFSYMTFSKEVNEAKTILDYALQLPFVSKVIVMGLSMGGAVATQVARERIDDIDKLILWAPAGNMNKIVDKKEYQIPSMANGNYDLGGIELGQDFIDDIRNYDLFKDANNFNKPVALFHGTNDPAVPLSVSEKYKELYPNSELHIYQDGDHTFNNVAIRKKLFADNVKFILD